MGEKARGVWVGRIAGGGRGESGGNMREWRGEELL